jgi:membrane protein implicated in regulation of membrane protease activity
MSWEDFFLVCFLVGLILSVVSALGGFAHLHLGHTHAPVLRAGLNLTHGAQGTTGAGHAPHAGRGLAAVNGFTVTAFLCWFGGAGYLLERYSLFVVPLVLLGAICSGVVGAAILWAALFRFLLPRERVLTAQETEMSGVVAHVSDQIRDGSGIGEIIFSQTGSRKCAAARSEDGRAIERGAEVVVMRYERGVAYVKRWEDLT